MCEDRPPVLGDGLVGVGGIDSGVLGLEHSASVSPTLASSAVIDGESRFSLMLAEWRRLLKKHISRRGPPSFATRQRGLTEAHS